MRRSLWKEWRGVVAGKYRKPGSRGRTQKWEIHVTCPDHKKIKPFYTIVQAIWPELAMKEGFKEFLRANHGRHMSKWELKMNKIIIPKSAFEEFEPPE